MHVKEVSITGFRSYRETTTIDTFSPGHNVVVGRNGSGKSNFFFAIQFVLSEEFAHLKAEQRLGILHEGTGPRTQNARVEIVFDNSDRRIVAHDAAEVRVARHVSAKKEVYHIDGRIVTRTDVMNLMESAGFSRSNPYYIVKQGKINELATAPDPHRLKLLREIAGTRVYDEKKEESMKILRETQTKKQKIEDLLQYIDGRLKTLEEEKEDLKEYQKWDKMKRSLEYTIYDNEIKDARSKLDKLAEQREEMNIRQNRVASQLMDAQNRGMKATAEQRKLEAKFKGMKDEKEALQAEENERVQQKTKLELRIKDLQEDVDRERSGRNNAEDNLTQLKTEIQAKQEQLEQLKPKFQELLEQEGKLATDLRIAEEKCRNLFAKQGHKNQFKTVEERDAYLRKELRHLERQIAEAMEQEADIERSREEDEKELDAVTADVQAVESSLNENAIRVEKAGRQHLELKKKLDEAIVANHNTGREEKSTRESVNGVVQDIQSVEQQLRQLANKSIMNGVDSVRKVINHFREAGDAEIVDGYHGILMDHINCDPLYFQAVEVTAGNRLYFHIVETDRIATKILRKMNELHLPGEANFFPINRLVARDAARMTDSDGRPYSEDARLMFDVIPHDVKYKLVFLQIFGQVAIVRNMEVGPRICRDFQVDCVTLDGDQISRRGTYTGGYIDAKRSKLELRKTLHELEDQRLECQGRLEEAQRDLRTRAKEVDKIRLEIDKVDNDVRNSRDAHRTLTDKKRLLSEQLASISRRRDQRPAQALQERNRVREMRARKEAVEAEVGTDMLTQMTKDETAMAERLQREIKDHKRELEQITKQRSEVESRKHRLENLLNNNLFRKRDQLTNKIEDISVDDKRHSLLSEQAELNSVLARIREIMKKKGELDESLQDYDEQTERLTRELEDVQEQQKDLDAQLADFSKQADQIVTEQSTLQSKREEALKKVRDLGSLPSEAFSKYNNLNAKQLDKKLAECMNELKKYENVNKKALDQFVQASSQKEELAKRRDEQEANEKSIENLLEVLENRKYDAIHLTFKQVCKNFCDVFKQLVPGGKGELVMRTDDSESSSSVLSDATTSRPLLDLFKGVGVKVSFTGQDDTREMQQLSGGQKTLVALAMIFAIQKCDPAPFYLFDEIDAALDAQHRKAVADMIHELSSSAQFITTTFRPELLDHAEKCFGVRFRNKVSHIDEVSKEQALEFVEDDTTHG